METSKKPIEKNKIRQAPILSSGLPDKTAPRTSHATKAEDIKTVRQLLTRQHRFSNIPKDLISDLSASEGGDGDLVIKLAALQDQNRANVSVDNSPYAEHYSDIISHSTDSSVLDLHVSIDSLASNPFANNTAQNPLFVSREKSSDLEISSSAPVPPLSRTGVQPGGVDEKGLAERNAKSMQSVSAQLKLANELAQKMIGKRNVAPGGINRLAPKTSSIENLHSTPRASVLSSTEPVLLYNEFEAYKKTATETIAKLEQRLADEDIVKQRLQIIQLENEQLEKQNSKLTEENNQFKAKLLDAENSAILLKNSMDAQKAELDGFKKNAGDLGFVRQEAKKRSSTPPGALQFTPPLVNVTSASSPLKVSYKKLI